MWRAEEIAPEGPPEEELRLETSGLGEKDWLKFCAEGPGDGLLDAGVGVAMR